MGHSARGVADAYFVFLRLCLGPAMRAAEKKGNQKCELYYAVTMLHDTSVGDSNSLYLPRDWQQ
jgi:hypothetical protein